MSTRVLTIGTWDLLHHGHLRLLERAATYGQLTVGVNSDRFVRRYKRVNPVVSHVHRSELLRALRCVEATVINDGCGAEVIRTLKPDLLVVGSDWLGKDYPAQIGMTADELTKLGVAVLFLPRTPDVSTTQMRAA